MLISLCVVLVLLIILVSVAIEHYSGPRPVPVRAVTIDGEDWDWRGIIPVTTDGKDPKLPISGIDIKELYIAADSTNLYCMITLWDPPASETFIHNEDNYSIHLTKSMSKGTPIDFTAKAWRLPEDRRWCLCIYDSEGVNMVHGKVELAEARNVVEFAIPWKLVGQSMGLPLPETLYITAHIHLEKEEHKVVDATDWMPFEVSQILTSIPNTASSY